jgi:hypothetical protein
LQVSIGAQKAAATEDFKNHFRKLHCDTGCDELLILSAEYFGKSDPIPKDFATQAPQFKPFISLLAISPTSAQKSTAKQLLKIKDPPELSEALPNLFQLDMPINPQYFALGSRSLSVKILSKTISNLVFRGMFRVLCHLQFPLPSILRRCLAVDSTNLDIMASFPSLLLFFAQFSSDDRFSHFWTILRRLTQLGRHLYRQFPCPTATALPGPDQLPGRSRERRSVLQSRFFVAFHVGRYASLSRFWASFPQFRYYRFDSQNQRCARTFEKCFNEIESKG